MIYWGIGVSEGQEHHGPDARLFSIEHQIAKVEVAGSNPMSRSYINTVDGRTASR
jgi:hypothetical protein